MNVAAANKKDTQLRIGWGVRLTILFASLSCVAYAMALIPPKDWWPAGFLSMTVPFFLFGNLMLLIFWLIVRPLNALVPTVALLLGYRFVLATVGLHTARPVQPDQIHVVSFNVQTFQGYGKHTADRIVNATRLLKWIQGQKADIICLQEFYDRPQSYIYNTTQRLSENAYKHYYYSPMITMGTRGSLGLMIMSRHKIVGKGTIFKSERNNNQILYADVKLPQGTVRVYNVHMQSIGLLEEELDFIQHPEEAKRRLLPRVFRKLRSGFVKRSQQLAVLENSIAQSPYPVLVCGDINELPYGNTYFRLKRRLQNAFEEAGSGFGFTFRGGLPGLRIDHQFADQNFKVTGFEVHRDVNQSDHYPIAASYVLAPKKAQ